MREQDITSLNIDTSEFEKLKISAVAIVLFDKDGRVFLKQRKKDSETALISGVGRLHEEPDNPDKAILGEVFHSIGLNVPLARMFVDTGSNQNIGVYAGFVENSKAALGVAGNSIGRKWVDLEKAVGTELYKGQEKYIKRVWGMINKNAQ
ncbi:NUDIX hydrolase [Candidatus Shapirobacteria bacterium]|nr:NUDIX hydrolase [Candidatus Shapirobacteria bacterium]